MQTVSFPIYGMAGWNGPRWLSMANGLLGGEVTWVTLANEPVVRSGPWVEVMSGDVPEVQGGLKWEEDVAVTATHELINRTLPDPSSRPEGLLREVGGFIFAQAQRWSSWTTVNWLVDGRPVQAAVLAWSGVWAGFVRSARMGLVVVAEDVPSDGLSLARADGSRDYHCVLHPVTVPADIQASRTAALGRSNSFYERPRQLHPDMERLVEQH